jgi:hypothetical protein
MLRNSGIIVVLPHSPLDHPRSLEDPQHLEAQTDGGSLRLTLLSPTEATIDLEVALPSELHRCGDTERSLIAAIRARFHKLADALRDLAMQLSSSLPPSDEPATHHDEHRFKWHWSYRFDDNGFELAPSRLWKQSNWHREAGFDRAALAAWLDAELKMLKRSEKEQTEFLLECVRRKKKLDGYLGQPPVN